MRLFADGNRITTPQFLTLQDGSTVHLAEMDGRIEKVVVPAGRAAECWSGLPRDCEALVTSILIVPVGRDLRLFDTGDLIFRYNDRVRFRAPVQSLMDRYHGLATAGALMARARLLFDPGVGADDWLGDGVFTGSMPAPIHMRENLSFAFEHVPGSVDPESFGLYDLRVEMQMLIKNAPLKIEWKDTFR